MSKTKNYLEIDLSAECGCAIDGTVENGLLKKFSADAGDQRVRPGPVEATAVRNILMQAIALG